MKTDLKTINYVYAFQGDKAVLQSPLIAKSSYPNGLCFKFWYHALGSSIGSLRIYDSYSQSPTLWQIQGQQSYSGYDWIQGVLPLNNVSNQYFRLAIEGTVGSGPDTFLGDIALVTVFNLYFFAKHTDFFKLISWFNSRNYHLSKIQTYDTLYHHEAI